MGGDFNIQLHQNGPNSPLGSNLGENPSRPSSQRARYIATITTLLNQYQLADVWPHKFPRTNCSTFHRGSQHSTLDYWFIPQRLLDHVSKYTISPQPLSDHSTLSLLVGINPQGKGPGYWKFDNQLLEDTNFVSTMNEHIPTLLDTEFDNPMSLWEWVKYKIRQFCIQYTATANKERRAHTKALEDRLTRLSHDHDLQGSPDIQMEAASIKRELAEIKIHQANNIIFRARARWAMYGEKPSAYFLGLEKRQRKANIITAIRDPQGNVLSNPTDILSAQKSFFENIYTEVNESLSPLDTLPLTEEDFPKISSERKKMLELPFSPREFYSALKDLGRNKSPGTDGITREFYLKFWHLLADPFFNSITFSLANGLLSNEQRAGIITLIPKKDGDRLELGNWRPITLLNNDFKIFSKALSKRIQPCMNKIISEDQTGFIRGRTIGTNIMNTQTIIEHSEISSNSGFLLAVDYAKAFDSIRWSLLYKALESFGFGEFIIKSIKLLFQDIKTSITNNGFSSGYFHPTRGIRQGCCSSPSLFVIAVELMAIMIRKNTQIKGIQTATKSTIISQYADDTTIFVSDYPSLRAAILTLHQFANWSGLKINLHKSHLLLLGNHLDPPPPHSHRGNPGC